MTSKQIVKAYELINRQFESLVKKKAELQKIAIASGNCDHSHCQEWERRQDDGYGRWWTAKMKRCRICGKVFRYSPCSNDWLPTNSQDY